MTEKVPHFVIGKSAKFGGAKTMQEWVSLQESSREVCRKACFRGSFGSACASSRRFDLMRISKKMDGYSC